MSSQPAAQADIQKRSSDNPKPGKKKRRRAAQVTCQICHRRVHAITAEHLREHGFTLTRYRRAYRANTRAPGTYGPGTDPNLHADDAMAIATRIVTDPAVIRDMAGEVAEAIFTTELRDRFRLGLCALIARRMEMHGKAAATLDAVRAELGQGWRLARGGPNGAPTPTKDLVAIGQLLATEVKHGEELLLKTVKLCLEEHRTNKGLATLDGGLLDRYTGEGEVLPVPSDLTASDRETVRTLMGMLDQAVTAKRSLIVDAEHTPVAGMVPAVSPASNPPAAEDAADPLPDVPSPVEAPADVLCAEEDTPTRDPFALGPDEPF